MKLNIWKKAILAILVLLPGFLSAQYGKQIPMDARIRYGKLDNGLTYYIRANKEPKERAEFYIAQNVGAILENDDQNGLAHFLEHMAFNGTKNFPGKGVINYLEKSGVKFGRNINAYTSLDETVYNLSNVPTTRQALIDSALLVLHDWSSFISLENKEIDAERGVIREEWRQGSNAARRMWKESNKLKYPGSQYSKRDIIGDTAVINNFKYQTLRDYYKKWYRPDLQAILVVGDINVDEIEGKIKKMFADIPKPVNPAERVVYDIPNNKEPIVAVVTDPEAQNSIVSLEYKHPAQSREYKLSEMGYYHSVINSLISMMMGDRYDEITLQPDASIIGAGAGFREIVKSKDGFIVNAAPKAGKILEGLNTILLETERMKRFGFTESELERAKITLLKSYEKSYNERDKQNNNRLVSEYVRNFTSDEPIPGIEYEYNYVKENLPKITAEEVNAMANRYITDENLIITISAPDKEEANIPSKEQILAALQNSKTTQLTAKTDDGLKKELIENKPAAGSIKKITKNTAIGTTEILFSNGVRAIFKPTTYKQDEILLSAYSYGGLSKIKNLNDLPSANLAATIVDNNGIGEFDPIALKKVLTGKIANVTPFISDYEEGMSGSSSISDLETMLQLVYLYFTATRKDDNSFNALRNIYKTTLANSAQNPTKAFRDSISVMLSGRDPRLVLLTPELIDTVDQDKAIEIYKQRFANPADFTFVLVGNIDPNNKETQKLLSTYLGGLKTTSMMEKWDKVRKDMPKGKINNFFSRNMKVNKASNYIYYWANLPYTLQNNTTMEAIGNLLYMRYTESIREKEGASYSVGVRGGANNIPEKKAALTMQFDTDPDKQDKILNIIHQEVNEMVKNGPLVEDLDKVKKNMLKQYAEDIEQNNWWRNRIKQFYQDKINYSTGYKTAVNALTPQLIQKTLKSLTLQGNIIQVVMTPQKK